MEGTKTDSLQHCQQYRLRLTLVHLFELPARNRNLVSKKFHFSASSIPAAGVWYSAFVELLAFWSSKSLLFFKKMETPPLEVDKELKYWQ